MKLTNTSRLSTERLRAIFEDVARQAGHSLRGVTIEVHRGTKRLHGMAWKTQQLTKLWLPDNAQDDSIRFLFAHELAHLVQPHLKRKKDREARADEFALHTTGMDRKRVVWRKDVWSNLRGAYANKHEATEHMITTSRLNSRHLFEFRVIKGPIQWLIVDKGGRQWKKCSSGHKAQSQLPDYLRKFPEAKWRGLHTIEASWRVQWRYKERL